MKNNKTCFFWAVTKSGTGTLGLGSGRGTLGCGTRGRETLNLKICGTRGRGDVGLGNLRLGTQGRGDTTKLHSDEGESKE